MNTQLERVLPMDIEKRSFKIIESELPHPIDPALAPIIKRVIHTSADFEYADTLCFSEDVVAKVHMSFIIGNDQPGKQTEERIKEAAMSMGYRFEIREFRVKEGEGALVRIANVGVAPIYRDTYVQVKGVRSRENLRDLMPGEEMRILIPCRASASSIPSIACDHLVSGQQIEYEAHVK